MQDLVEVAALDQFASESARVVVVAGDAIALFRVDGRIFALGDTCLRCGASIGAGRLCGHVIQCSRCDWRYDVTSGAVAGVPALRAETFDVELSGDRVLLAPPAAR